MLYYILTTCCKQCLPIVILPPGYHLGPPTACQLLQNRRRAAKLGFTCCVSRWRCWCWLVCILGLRIPNYVVIGKSVSMTRRQNSHKAHSSSSSPLGCILLQLRIVNGPKEEDILRCLVASGVMYSASAASHFRVCGKDGHQVQHYLARI